MPELSAAAKARDNRAFYILSLGCSKNQCDAERLNGALINAGFSPASGADEADYVIINTCGFINDAKKESIDVILDAIDLRENNPDVKIIVVGCLAKRYFDEIKNDIPEADLVYGIIDDGLVAAIESLDGASSGSLILPDGRVPLEEGLPYEYIKIAEGCSNNCSYCAIPLIRGPHQSFSPDDVVKDAQSAVRRGARELIVIAQDIAQYNYKGHRLPGLLRQLADSGADWIRL
ncbi:MAG: radical SAM protein, partial [Spirochaetota bacterium]